MSAHTTTRTAETAFPNTHANTHSWHRHIHGSGDHGATLYNYGVLLHEAKRFDDAQRVLQDAVAGMSVRIHARHVCAHACAHVCVCAVVREVYGEEHASFEQVFGELEEVSPKSVCVCACACMRVSM